MEPKTTDIWALFQDRLRGFLRKRVDANDVDDVLQEVFVRIHRALSRGDLPRDLTAWVFHIARTTVVDAYRKRGPAILLPYLEDKDTREAPGAPGLDAVTRTELSRCVRPLLDALSPDQRQALMWTTFDGLSQTEAARRAQISVSGMKSRVQRARKQLAHNLLSCCQVTFDRRGRPIDVASCARCGHP